MPLYSQALLSAMLTALPISGPSSMVADDAALARIVDQRLAGDRTGACIAVAVIEADRVARTYRCADPKDGGRIGPDHAFEIGSVSKTMTAALLADLILRNKASLDDALADYLPEGTAVPTYQGQPILLRHVVTHTSGLPALPSRLGQPDMDNPYAQLSMDALFRSLGDVTLMAAPGTRFEYSNFASMVLSYAVARRAGSDFESLLQQRVFEPLGMRRAYINTPPAGVRAAIGHTPNRQATSAWAFSTDLAGAGGVRATLDDMVHYLQGNLALLQAPIVPALKLAQQKVSDQPAMAMNWMLLPVAGRSVHVHEGGTGGFSSFVAVDRDRGRGVVILSDTTWNSIGGLGSLGLHLVDASFPLGKPRKLAEPSQALLDGLVGDYQLQGAMKMTLRQRQGRLFIKAEGQDEYAMEHDDAGDFFPQQLDAVLRPQRKANGDHAFIWMQMGAALPASRIRADDTAPAVPTLTPAQLDDYVGDYPLQLGFVLSVRARDGQLHAQATGQGEFPLQASGKDTFEAPAFGIEIVFQRDATGTVTSLELHQGGQLTRGTRQPAD